MKKCFLQALSALVFLSSSLSAVAASKDLPATLELDGRQWIKGNQIEQPGELTVEYLTDGETVKEWNEVYSVQQFDQIDVPPREFFQLFLQGLQEAAGSSKVESKILSQTDTELLAEWWVAAPSLFAQHEWVRLVKKGNEVTVIRYTTRKLNEIEAARGRWEKILKTIEPPLSH